MKKCLLIVGVLALLLSTSCRKDYTCKCTTSVGGVASGTATTVFHDTKSRAQDKCDDMSYDYGYGVSLSCELE